MLIAAVQHDIVWEDKAANHRVVEAMLDDAALPPRTFVVLPELGDTGFSFNLDRIVDDRTLAWASRVAKRLKIWLQVGHAQRSEQGRGRNCATIVDPEGVIVGGYEKLHPFSFGRESEHFDRGEHLLLRRCDELHVCPLVCYDLRFPEIWRLAALAGDQRAELFTIGASWPDARQTHWRTLLIARAIENQAFVVGVNRVGSDPHLKYAGGSIILSPTGAVLAEAGAEPAVITAELDPRTVREWRKSFPALRDTRVELLGHIPIDTTTTATS